MRKIFILFPLILFSLILGACGPNISPNTYNGNDVGSVSEVKHGHIIAMRFVNIDNSSGIGGFAGALAGGAAGSTIGGSGAANVVGAVGGAVVGGLLGNAIDNDVNHHNGTQYFIKLRNGHTVSVVEPGHPHFAIHEPVLVLFGYGPHRTRIIPDDGQPYGY